MAAGISTNQLLEVADVRRSAGASAAGTTTLTGTVDLQNYDAACVIVSLSGIVNGAQPVLTLQDGVQSNGSDAANITDANGNAVSTSAVTLTGTPSTGLMIADVARPAKRYLTWSLARTTQNVAVDAVIVVLYRGKNMPATPATAYLSKVVTPAAT
jgi:hypothetical protein